MIRYRSFNKFSLLFANVSDFPKCCFSNAIQNERNNALLPSVHFRHTALLRNKRCILAYLYHRIRRLRQMRWELSSILPTEITVNLLNAEMQWFQNYNKSLATYMRSIGDDHGLNLTVNMSPPKTLYVEVNIFLLVSRIYGRTFIVQEHFFVFFFHLNLQSSCFLLYKYFYL